MVSLQQQQHTARLMLAAALLFQQPFKEAAGRLTQLGEPLPENRQVLVLVPRRAMSRIDAALACQEQLSNRKTKPAKGPG